MVAGVGDVEVARRVEGEALGIIEPGGGRRAMRRLSQEWRKASDAARRTGDRASAVELARKALGYQLTPRALWAWLAAQMWNPATIL